MQAASTFHLKKALYIIATVAAIIFPSFCFGEIKSIELADLVKLALIDYNEKNSFHSYKSVNNKIGPFKQMTADSAFAKLKLTYDRDDLFYFYGNQYIVNYKKKALAIKNIDEAAEWDVILSGSKATPTHLFIQSNYYSREDFIPNINYFAKYGVVLEPIICSVESGSPVNNTGYYVVKSRNKIPALIIIQSSSGSAGNSFRLELTWGSWDLREIIKYEHSSFEYSYPIKIGLCELRN